MIAGTYRKRAGRALLTAAVVSASVVGIGVFAVLAGWQAFTHLATAVVGACLRVWALLPGAFQVMLGISVAIGFVSGGLWLLSAGKQWRRTTASLRSLHRKAVDPPPRIHALLVKHKLDQQVKIFRDGRPRALTTGLITPRIMVSTGLIEALENDELEAVLLHEQSHVRHKDPFYLLLAGALTTAFFYVAAVSALVRRYQAAMELAADEDVIATQGESLSLSSAMVKLLRARPSAASATPFTGAADLRLAYLLGRDVDLPGVTRQAVLQGAAVVVITIAPVAAIHGLAAALNQAAFLSRCAV